MAIGMVAGLRNARLDAITTFARPEADTDIAAAIEQLGNAHARRVDVHAGAST